ncbi:Sec-independent protein translocase protein TatB [Sphingomonas mucosissima]|uniref:Sec-independent protein translocase protein TatB n=1 Tax=Sphingomonas mucosissima TaxID=370959 RepID=A0A245ZET0_9SPHN|nr:Sec-independent protein translocase protein TatB [Sphingomonas mucosissima]OWK28252.1 Sec-independent protein translocase protein TatB [Sphingomonas mucosissima]
MLDFNFSEMAVVALVALLVIGPKDLPKALRVLGYWVGKARGVARQFRAGFDEMVREAELADMEKKWKEENERIMREHPMLTPAAPAHGELASFEAPASDLPCEDPTRAEGSAEAIMVERPEVMAGPASEPPLPQDKAAS